MHTSDIFQISIFAVILAALSLWTGISDAAGNSSSLDRKTREPAQKLIPSTTPVPVSDAFADDDFTTPEDEEDEEDYTEEEELDLLTEIPTTIAVENNSTRRPSEGPLPGSTPTPELDDEEMTSVTEKPFSSTTSTSSEVINESTLTIDEEEKDKAGSGMAGITLKAPHSEYVEGSGGGPLGRDGGKMSTGKGSDPDAEDDFDVTDEGGVEGSGATPSAKDIPSKIPPIRFQVPGNELVPEGSGVGPGSRESWEVDNTHSPGQVTTASTALPPALTEPPNNDLTFSTPDSMSEQDKEFLGVNQPEIVEKQPNQHTSLLAQPAMLAAVIGGAVVGLLCAILLVMYLIYRMRKKDEGSYALDEPAKRPGGYMRAPTNSGKEYYA